MNERDFALLIRSAGRRPAIPPDDLERIREVARAAWHTSVAASQRARRLRIRGAMGLAASALLAVVAWWWFATPSPPPSEEIAVVERATGRVEPLEIRAGGRVSSGTTLITGTGRDGSPGTITLRLEGGQSVRLDEATRLSLMSGSRLELQRGAVYVDSGPTAPKDAHLEVVTPLGVVTEIGTQYEVRLEEGTDTLRLRVREGAVSLSHGGESHSVEGGRTLDLGRDGSLTRGVVAPDGPEWEWAMAAAPALDIEGQSLEWYLRWVARETGRDVRYGDRELERSARTIRLHGTVEGLRPDESLQAILEGSGLDYRFEDGAILVFRP